MPEQEIPRAYLGDGAYVEDQGHCICIYTDNGVTRHNEVFLESNEIQALQRFLLTHNLIK